MLQHKEDEMPFSIYSYLESKDRKRTFIVLSVPTNKWEGWETIKCFLLEIGKTKPIAINTKDLLGLVKDGSLTIKIKS